VPQQRGMRLGDQAEFTSLGNRLDAACGAELAEYVAGVLLHGFQRDHELIGDLPVRPAGCDQAEDLQFALG
jgi:hypothetical protein